MQVKHQIKSLIVILAMTSAYQAKLTAQDVEQIVTEKPVRFTGSLSAQAVGYTTTRDRPGRDPFTWTLSGSPTLSLYGINIPFSFAVSRKHSEFRQPFNQFGMSPYYKWIKVHAGYRNITFSRYTLAGHRFLGGGLELTPGNFRAGIIYGKFLEVVEDDSMNVDYVIPVFRRTGYAVKLGYGPHSNYVDLILFKGKDDSASIGRPPLEHGVLPAENLVVGIRTYQRFLKRFTLDIDLGLSAYTRNLYATEVGIPDVPLGSLVHGLTSINNSTNLSWAGNGSFSYSHPVFGIRLIYRRIDPEYRSMGAYFFQNDLEQVTIDPSLHLFKRTLQLRGSLGYQRNNLAQEKVENTFRRIHSLHVNYHPGRSFGLNGSYMNYRIEQTRNPLIIKDFVDSLQMKQVSNNLSLNMDFSLGEAEVRHRFSAGASYQSFIDENAVTEALNTSRSLSPFFNYRLSHEPAGLSFYGRINLNIFNTVDLSQDRLGFTVGGSSRLAGERLYLDLSGTHYRNRVDKQSNGGTVMLRTRVNYRMAAKHSLNLSLNFISRNFRTDERNNFNELLARLGYTMRI